MKSALSMSVFGRRAATGTVLALAAATLSFGVAGPASAANTIELQGTVTGASGAPLENVDVTAYDADTGDYLEGVVTDASGHYQFDDDVVIGSVKLNFEPNNPSLTLTSAMPYQVRWSGGSRYKAGATITSTSVDPVAAPVVNANLPQFASITGNITVAEGHVPTNFYAYSADMDENWWYDDYEDSATGNYRLIVDPSGPVRVGASAWDNPAVGDDVNYLDSYWMNADTLASATPINVAPGQTVSGINFRLTNALTARQAPSVHGYPTVGRALTATPGTWSRNSGTEYSYTWKRGATVVGAGATYVPTVADYHQRLTLTVAALNGEHAGQAVSVPSDIVRYAATERIAAKAKAGAKVALAIKVVSSKQKPVKGKVVVMRGNKVVHKAVRLVNGKVVLVLKHQPKGHQTYTVHYKGNKILSQVDKTFTVRVHK